MNRYVAGALGGLAAGVLTTAVMTAGRKPGALGKTLDRDAVDWIDRNTGARGAIGDAGSSAVEFVNHLGASAAFGAGYAELRRRFPDVQPVLLAALYGAGLYAVNIAGIAPLLGITEGEVEAGPRKAGERLAVHLIQTIATALVAERIAPAPAQA